MKFLALTLLFIGSIFLSSLEASPQELTSFDTSLLESEKSEKIEIDDDREDLKCERENFKISYMKKNSSLEASTRFHQQFYPIPNLKPPKLFS